MIQDKGYDVDMPIQMQESPPAPGSQPASDSQQTLRTEIQAAGLKVTTTRLAVLTTLTANPHADADTIFRAVARHLPSTSVQAVYGVLGAFTEAGIIRRIEPAGSAALYERRIGDNHHHLICSNCRKVCDVDCVTGEAPCLTPSDPHGFSIQTAEVTFWGICPQCQKSQRQSDQPSPH